MTPASPCTEVRMCTPRPWSLDIFRCRKNPIGTRSKKKFYPHLLHHEWKKTVHFYASQQSPVCVIHTNDICERSRCQKKPPGLSFVSFILHVRYARQVREHAQWEGQNISPRRRWLGATDYHHRWRKKRIYHVLLVQATRAYASSDRVWCVSFLCSLTIQGNVHGPV